MLGALNGRPVDFSHKIFEFFFGSTKNFRSTKFSNFVAPRMEDGRVCRRVPQARLAKIESGVSWHEEAQVPGSSDGLSSADPGAASPALNTDIHEPAAAGGGQEEEGEDTIDW